MKKKTTKNSCNLPTTVADSWKEFKTAYEMLSEACYIPEKKREGIIKFMKKSKIPVSHLPTKMKILQFKITLDERLRFKFTSEEIYKILELE